ncbi:MAG: phospholipid tracking outer membrane liporotein MlaA [Rhodobacteraceae bacterium HLUCCA08]|nr:MAG: phospholipid tracking outer membrane liporotein MlaA [Rhodobacteraceae bacterium HLUCCA08]
MPDAILPMPVSIRRKPGVFCAFSALLVGLAACTAPQPGAEFNDPYEATNRVVHGWNKGLDRAVLRPTGQVMTAAPVEVTQPVRNFADNVGLPGMVVNGILQGDIDSAATNTFRFLINSSIGVLGLFDPATAIGLPEDTTDFGATLAVWGVPEGAYLELPVLGPSTERDAAGRIVDFALDPLRRVGTPHQVEYGTAARVADIAITRGRFGETFDDVLYGSADSYAQARLAYLQNRRFELGEAPPEADAIDPFSPDLSLEGFE